MFTPNHRITSLPDRCIFVFGSNIEGRHAGGAARDAVDNFGAVWGIGDGLQGRSYAIPTMHGDVDAIKPYVNKFIDFAKAHQELSFYVTPIGCGIAGRPLSDMAGLFKEALTLKNVLLPRAFVLAIYAEDALTFGAEGHFIDNCEVFPLNAFQDLERAEIICTDHSDEYMIIKRGNKYGLFDHCYIEELKLRSVGPAFGYDEILFLDNHTGYSNDGYYKNYDGYVALDENGHWSVLALDCNDPLVLVCEGDSLETVTQIVANLSCLRHVFWKNPIELKREYNENRRYNE